MNRDEFVAVKLSDKFYSYKKEEYNPPNTLGELFENDNKDLDSPYFMDNLNTLDNVSKNTHTKLFKLQFAGASGSDFRIMRHNEISSK